MEKKYYDEKDIIKGLKFAKRMNEFVSYVYDFYGKNGIYDMGATVSQITTATIDYIASLSVYNNHQKFCEHRKAHSSPLPPHDHAPPLNENSQNFVGRQRVTALLLAQHISSQ